MGYSHDREGAVAAAARYQVAFADPAVLNIRELKRRIRAVATPDFAPTLTAATEPGAARIAAGPVGAGVRAGVKTTYLGVPVSYDLVSYTPRRAVVRTWGFTVIGNGTTVEPAAYFGLTQVELVWLRGDWKIAMSRGGFGPTPRLVTPREGGEGFRVADVLEGMRAYVVAP